MFWRLNVICWLLIFSSCQSDQEKHSLNKPKEIAFYYWQQEFKLDEQQKDILKYNKVQRIYTKFFDVSLNESTGVVNPVAKIDFKETSKNVEIIPCVFIENRVFSKGEHPDLAKKVYELVQALAKKYELKIDEIQLDCDWSQTTKKRYFNFLKQIKKIAKNKELITSTIRLHQFKYPEKTGVPPVSKGLLMCYNMDDIMDIDTKNSIISSATLKSYVDGVKKYPIHLDLALPIYQWGLIYRLGKLVEIVNEIQYDSLDMNLFQSIGNNQYKADTSFYFNKTYFCDGDILRIEKSNATELKKCARVLAKSNQQFERILFYHLGAESIKHYETNFFSDIASIVR